MLREKGVDIQEEQAVEAFFNTFPYQEGSYATRYFVSLFSNYFDIKKQLRQNQKNIERLFDQVYKINQPVTHRYQLERIDQ
jgi:dimeric dUTPase (all-alpha-NTP-PPase superfamily)